MRYETWINAYLAAIETLRKRHGLRAYYDKPLVEPYYELEFKMFSKPDEPPAYLVAFMYEGQRIQLLVFENDSGIQGQLYSLAAELGVAIDFDRDPFGADTVLVNTLGPFVKLIHHLVLDGYGGRNAL
ncbi:hypothetical protein AVT69_gp282 [Pseudomonas phage PhiPA3]|uniref:Uncharacterized protein 284 n=1 Tax=Pseudomonas phage PhiPA3 TaxID=998086 RepID=F8SJC0_BPPA3|nr:hypothetical protein AVT69_gp282 [Pseudomonas phage PhiPA3]AEH03707.1 hypothetical protein [Pseudomonas phage PhiPA3]